MSDEAYPTKQKGGLTALIIPTEELDELWRGYLTVLEHCQGLPISMTERGDKLRKLARALRGDGRG